MTNTPKTTPEDETVAGLLTNAGPRPDVPAEDLAVIHDAAEMTWRRVVRRRKRARIWGWAAATAAAIGLAVVGLQTLVPGETSAAIATVAHVRGPLRAFSGSAPPRMLSVGDVADSSESIGTGAGHAALRLPSGTELRLGPQTRVSFAGERQLDLAAGRLYLDSGDTTLEDASLLIRTAVGDVREIGTRFLVEVDGERLVVRVRSGRIRLDAYGSSLDAVEGESLTVRADGEIERADSSPYDSSWDWVQSSASPFPLEGETLARYLEWLQRETGWSVLFLDGGRNLSQTVLHGSLEGLRPDQSPAVVFPSAGLAWELEGDILRLRSEGS